MVKEVLSHAPGGDQAAVESYLHRFHKAPIEEKGVMLEALKREAKSRAVPALLSPEQRKGLRKVYRGELVKRTHLFRIVAAWLITVPLSALLGVLFFFAMRGAMLP
jgi:PiT family inorganic phosphate transporter